MTSIILITVRLRDKVEESHSHPISCEVTMCDVYLFGNFASRYSMMIDLKMLSRESPKIL